MKTMRRFEGQTAIVTGAARGLGHGIARRLGGEGAALALLDLDAEEARAAAAAFRAEGIDARAGACDVSRPDEVERAIAEALGHFGKIDVLVNCAGINGVTNRLTHELALEDFDRVLEINLRGTFLCTRAVLPAMLKANYGRIVNVASISGKHGNPGMVAYTASKAAIIGMTKAIGCEYAETGITCNAIAPALVRTRATEAAHAPGRLQELIDLIPMKRAGRIEEIAAVVAFIASKECSFTTGFIFDASGGRAVY